MGKMDGGEYAFALAFGLRSALDMAENRYPDCRAIGGREQGEDTRPGFIALKVEHAVHALREDRAGAEHEASFIERQRPEALRNDPGSRHAARMQSHQPHILDLIFGEIAPLGQCSHAQRAIGAGARKAAKCLIS